MSVYLNRVLLMGNLTRDPDLRTTKGGQSFCEFSLAINRLVKLHDGQEREETCFVDLTIWGKQADACKKYLTKGRSVYVEGRLTLDQWESETGERKSRLRVVAERISFIGGGRQNDGGSGQ